VPPRRDDPPGEWENGADVQLPPRTPEAARNPEFEPGERAAGTENTRQLAEGRAGIGDVAQGVRERDGVEGVVVERQRLGISVDEADLRRQAVPCLGKHLGARVDADNRAALLREQFASDGAGSGRNVEDCVGGADVDVRDERPPPAWVLAQGKERGVPVVRRPERCEERPRDGGLGHAAESILDAVALADDVDRIAAAAAKHTAPGERVAAVLATEPMPGERVYLAAFEGEEGTESWLALDDEGAPVTDRKLVHDAAAIAALCEIAEESRDVAAAEELRLASPSYLDGLGVKNQNGDVVGALQGALPAVEELTRDVEGNYKFELT
jgi:hypothetical protein